MPFFERNSFVLRQLLQPGWVNRTNWLFMFSIVMLLRNERLTNGTYGRIHSQPSNINRTRI